MLVIIQQTISEVQMTKDELKPIDTSKYKITETGQVLKMTKDEMKMKMTKDEMKDKISMALKDPILQQGFEIICKNLAELEKENAELKEKLEISEKLRDYWKSSSFDWRHKCTRRKSFKVAVKAQKQLTKAKAILKEVLTILPKENIEGIYEIAEEAEQFLKE